MTVLDGFGVRSRVLLVAITVLLLTLLLWTWLFWRVFDAALIGSARGHAEVEAQQLASTLELVEPASAVPVRDHANGNDITVQVIDGSGQVVAASREDALQEPLTDEQPADGHVLVEEVDGLEGIDRDAFVLVARGATGVDGEALTVVVASPVHIEEGVESRIFLTGGLAAALVLAIAAILVRWAVGASLLPVERLRGQLAEIDGHTIGDRVDVPETGDELTRLAETMNQMLTRLEGAYAAQAGFVSDASHELRSPLSTLRTSVELAAADPTGQVWAETRPIVMNEILRLQRLVDDLLTLSKYDAGAVPLRRRECDLDDLVVEAVRQVRTVDGPAFAVAPEPVRAVADPDRLGQVLRNLLDNAGRYARSAVRVGLSADGDEAVVTVDNDGPPVAAEDRERVFDRFVRLDATRDRDTGGAGLGLAIAADIARAHGGTLVAGEADDGWCRFELRLPRE
ncbi:sensor histidine kinase [Nocardioides sp.]|uniref:sensor histidine kinase n=1 Tax=Nocardioides sp. TaxID=35761 RepID=UPI003526EBDF